MQPSTAAGTPQDPSAAELSPSQKELRYWHERQASAQRCGTTADEAVCERQIQALELAAQGSNPWAVIVQAMTDSQKAAANKLMTINEDLTEARQALAHFEAEGVKAQAALGQAGAALIAVQAEAPPAPAPPAATSPRLGSPQPSTRWRPPPRGCSRTETAREAAEARPRRSSSSSARWWLPLCAGPAKGAPAACAAAGAAAPAASAHADA
ncbi:unnamed protein product, partial [Prorocentrum cordatum]